MFDKITVKMIYILFFIFYLVASNTNHNVECMRSELEEDMELEKQLKHINKPSIKTIHTMFGYIVDCVDIEKQPAFDHPLLKNHKLQRKPSFQKTLGTTNEKNSSAKSIGFGLEKNQCPIGTVPIKRITKEDLIREKLLFKNYIRTPKPLRSHFAEATFGPFAFRRFYGASGTTNIWNPRVNHNQSSLSHMWIQNGRGDRTNKITVGWHVSPQLYNDYQTHVYTTWTSDNFKTTGCYNLQCPGFIQIDRQKHIGAVVQPSIYDGMISDLQVTLSQDPKTQNWWLINNGTNIGYFPAALFTNMKWADQVGWGGRTTTPLGTLSPSMGSGHFPDNNFHHSGYFIRMAYTDESRKDNGPGTSVVKSFTDKPKCYGVNYYGYEVGDVGYTLQFGGPGGSCDN